MVADSKQRLWVGFGLGIVSVPGQLAYLNGKLLTLLSTTNFSPSQTCGSMRTMVMRPSGYISLFWTSSGERFALLSRQAWVAGLSVGNPTNVNYGSVSAQHAFVSP